MRRTTDLATSRRLHAMRRRRHTKYVVQFVPPPTVLLVAHGVLDRHELGLVEAGAAKAGAADELPAGCMAENPASSVPPGASAGAVARAHSALVGRADDVGTSAPDATTMSEARGGVVYFVNDRGARRRWHQSGGTDGSRATR